MYPRENQSNHQDKPWLMGLIRDLEQPALCPVPCALCPVPYFLTGRTPMAFRSSRLRCLTTSKPRTGSGRRTFQIESPLHCHCKIPPPPPPPRCIPLPSLLPQDLLLLHPFNSTKHRFQYFSPPRPPDAYGGHRPRDPRGK